MSVNQFSSERPEVVWWAQQERQQSRMEQIPSQRHHPSSLYHLPVTAAAAEPQNLPFSFNLNQEEDDQETDAKETVTNEEEGEQQSDQFMLEQEIIEIPKTPMFEKPLTPSDVGKLNRLVIPKQHAEKYFPLGGGGDSGEKGLLLSFEDELGKQWRFRYSYWNSSQSYVLTKGWSRFVKEKRLDAGDIVQFERHRFDGNHLFIGWKRRSASASSAPTAVTQENIITGSGVVVQPLATANGGDGGWPTRLFYASAAHPYPTHPNGPPLPYRPDSFHAAATESVVVVGQKKQTGRGGGNSKRLMTLRLFGVNLECQTPQEQEEADYSKQQDQEPPTPEEHSGSGSGSGSSIHHAHDFLYYPSKSHHLSNHHNHMELNFSRDINQLMGYRQG